MPQNCFSNQRNAWIWHILTYFYTKQELMWHKKSKISYFWIRIPFDKSMFRLGAAGDSSAYVAGDR